MTKRVISLFLVLISLLSILPLSVFAINESPDADVIFLEDGNYIVVTTETSPARVANTVSGTKNYTCYNADNDVLWVAKLSATFAYSGGWYTCTTANCTVTINNSNWYVISNNTIRSSNNAVTSLTMGRKKAGITIEKPEYTIKLSCDINGRLT